jgi:hypothetical protein
MNTLDPKDVIAHWWPSRECINWLTEILGPPHDFGTISDTIVIPSGTVWSMGIVQIRDRLTQLDVPMVYIVDSQAQTLFRLRYSDHELFD